jgi:hypothetical protein
MRSNEIRLRLRPLEVAPDRPGHSGGRAKFCFISLSNMKRTTFCFISLLVLGSSLTLTAFGQTQGAKGTFHIGILCDDTNFTDKAEAKNQLVNGLKEGRWIEYLNSEKKTISDSTGATYYCLSIYANGKVCGVQRHYTVKGVLCQVTPYVDGKTNGILKVYWGNGKIFRIFPYQNGVMNGIVKEYYKSGKIKSEKTFTNGVQGQTIYYGENGNEIRFDSIIYDEDGNATK